MGFSPPNPEKVRFDRNAEKERAALLSRIALEEIEREEAERRRIKHEIHECYHLHTPMQIQHAGVMMRNHNDGARRVNHEAQANEVCWERIGRSRGGKTRGNLYRCIVA